MVYSQRWPPSDDRWVHFRLSMQVSSFLRVYGCLVYYILHICDLMISLVSWFNYVLVL
jgi:hypothetical protein